MLKILCDNCKKEPKQADGAFSIRMSIMEGAVMDWDKFSGDLLCADIHLCKKCFFARFGFIDGVIPKK